MLQLKAHLGYGNAPQSRLYCMFTGDFYNRPVFLAVFCDLEDSLMRDKL